MPARSLVAEELDGDRTAGMRACGGPEDIAERVRALCLALPEVMVRVDDPLTTARSTAQSFDIRRRSFCLLVAREDSAGKAVPLLVLRDRIVVVLTGNTDWEEIGQLVTDSYRILAPKKLTARLD